MTAYLKSQLEDWVESLTQASSVDVSRNDKGERKVRLLCSKTRVSPLKEITIPRLELMAALVLARFVSNVKKALAALIELEKQTYWSDSITVLYWLANK